MRNRGIIIFLIILLTIIIVALTSFLVLCLNGTIDFHNFKISFGTRKSENLIFNETYDIETINMIDIKQDAGDIIFENSEENNIKVEIYGENSEDFEKDESHEKASKTYKSEFRGNNYLN